MGTWNRNDSALGDGGADSCSTTGESKDRLLIITGQLQWIKDRRSRGFFGSGLRLTFKIGPRRARLLVTTRARGAVFRYGNGFPDSIWLTTPQLSASSIDLLAKSRHRPQSVRSPSLAAILLTMSSHASTKIEGAWRTQAPAEKWGSMQAINDS
jgi:hypothetical protein